MSIVGNWLITMNTPMGVQTPTLNVTEEGGAFKGFMDGPMGKADVEEITVDGNNFSFKTESDSPMGKMEVTFNGTMDGDKISGNITTPVGPIPFVGERQ